MHLDVSFIFRIEKSKINFFKAFFFVCERPGDWWVGDKDIHSFVNAYHSFVNDETCLNLCGERNEKTPAIYTLKSNILLSFK